MSENEFAIVADRDLRLDAPPAEDRAAFAPDIDLPHDTSLATDQAPVVADLDLRLDMPRPNDRRISRLLLATLAALAIDLGVLAIVDLTLTASLVVLVIFSGYANFVARGDVDAHPGWPRWMADIDFSELKLKLMSSIVAISAIKLLESFMEVEHESDRNLYFLVGIHLTFVVSTLLLALSDWLGHGTDAAAHGAAAKE